MERGSAPPRVLLAFSVDSESRGVYYCPQAANSIMAVAFRRTIAHGLKAYGLFALGGMDLVIRLAGVLGVVHYLTKPRAGGVLSCSHA